MKQFLHEKDFTRVGIVRKSYGYKGDVKLGVEELFEDDVLESDFLFLDIDGFRVPFRIESYDTRKHFLVKFDRIDDVTDAAEVIGREVYLLSENIIHAAEALSGKKEKHELIGYRLHDQTSNTNLLIEDLQEFPQQIMAVVNLNDREILIPLNDQFIEHINKEERVVHMNLPEGLLDL